MLAIDLPVSAPLKTAEPEASSHLSEGERAEQYSGFGHACSDVSGAPLLSARIKSQRL